MKINNLQELNALKQIAEKVQNQAAQKAYLIEKNKQQAREQLMRIRLELSKRAL